MAETSRTRVLLLQQHKPIPPSSNTRPYLHQVKSPQRPSNAYIYVIFRIYYVLVITSPTSIAVMSKSYCPSFTFDLQDRAFLESN